jgi:hypothetical protein
MGNSFHGAEVWDRRNRRMKSAGSALCSLVRNFFVLGELTTVYMLEPISFCRVYRVFTAYKATNYTISMLLRRIPKLVAQAPMHAHASVVTIVSSPYCCILNLQKWSQKEPNDIRIPLAGRRSAPAACASERISSHENRDRDNDGGAHGRSRDGGHL